MCLCLSPAGRVCMQPTGNSCALFCRGLFHSYSRSSAHSSYSSCNPHRNWTLPPLPQSWSEMLVKLKGREAYMRMFMNFDSFFSFFCTIVHASSVASNRPSVLKSAFTIVQPHGKHLQMLSFNQLIWHKSNVTMKTKTSHLSCSGFWVLGLSSQ